MTDASISRIVIRFLLDENVRSDVAEVLRERGHEVYLSRDITAPGAPDHLLATITAIDSLVFVTHDKDFKNFLKVLPKGHKIQMSKGSGRLQLLIPEAAAKARLEAELDFIELYHERCLRLSETFFVTVQKTGMRWNY